MLRVTGGLGGRKIGSGSSGMEVMVGNEGASIAVGADSDDEAGVGRCGLEGVGGSCWGIGEVAARMTAAGINSAHGVACLFVGI